MLDADTLSRLVAAAENLGYNEGDHGSIPWVHPGSVINALHEHHRNWVRPAEIDSELALKLLESYKHGYREGVKRHYRNESEGDASFEDDSRLYEAASNEDVLRHEFGL